MPDTLRIGARSLQLATVAGYRQVSRPLTDEVGG